MNDDAMAPSDTSSDPLLGLKVADVFEIEALIGVGASSRVYRAFHGSLQQKVAIKVLNREYLQAEDVRARFHREARVASRITHPAVVPVIMSGELPAVGVSKGEAFIVYEFVDGLTLRAVLNTKETLSVEKILGIIIATGEAIGAAHEIGIVHRDLKPENLMLVQSSDGSGRLRVLDFGLAKAHESAEIPLTHTGAVLGTPTYLSPEGARGQAATPRSDVYSLAVIAFECLAGHPPFGGTSTIQILMQQVDADPPPLTRPFGSGEVPTAVTRVIDDNLAKSPHSRAENGKSLAQALRRAAALSNIQVEDYGPASGLWRSSDALEDLAPSSGANSQTPMNDSGTS
jgi:serine/threonine-protein kinase